MRYRAKITFDGGKSLAELEESQSKAIEGLIDLVAELQSHIMLQDARMCAVDRMLTALRTPWYQKLYQWVRGLYDCSNSD